MLLCNATHWHMLCVCSIRLILRFEEWERWPRSEHYTIISREYAIKSLGVFSVGLCSVVVEKRAYVSKAVSCLAQFMLYIFATCNMAHTDIGLDCWAGRQPRGHIHFLILPATQACVRAKHRFVIFSSFSFYRQGASVRQTVTYWLTAWLVLCMLVCCGCSHALMMTERANERDGCLQQICSHFILLLFPYLLFVRSCVKQSSVEFICQTCMTWTLFLYTRFHVRNWWRRVWSCGRCVAHASNTAASNLQTASCRRSRINIIIYIIHSVDMHTAVLIERLAVAEASHPNIYIVCD